MMLARRLNDRILFFAGVLFLAASFLNSPALAQIKSCQDIFEEDSFYLSSPNSYENPQVILRRLQNGKNIGEANQLEAAITHELKTGEVKTFTRIGQGDTNPFFVKLKNGLEAIWKPVQHDIDYASESPLREMAAFTVDRKLETFFIPVTVSRDVNGIEGIMQLRVKELNSRKNEPTPDFFYMYDYLLANNDRHQNNYLVSGEHVFAIDHGRSFHEQSLGTFSQRIDQILKLSSIKPLQKVKAIQILKQITISKAVYQNLKSTTKSEWKAKLKPYLTEAEVTNFNNRQIEIVMAIDRAHSQLGDQIFAEAAYSPLMQDINYIDILKLGGILN